MRRALYDSARRDNSAYLVPLLVPFLPVVASEMGNFAISRFNVLLAIANLSSDRDSI